MAFQWTEELATGVEIVDRQHKEIFSRYNTYLAACRNGTGRAKLLELLDFLTSYVEEHFAEEESLMTENDYPDRDSHVGQHRQLTETVRTFRDQVNRQGVSVSDVTEINQMLFNWLLKHIKKSDAELGSYLNQRWGLF